MSLRVDTHISGSRCVIWFSNEHYIDVRKDVRTPNNDIAECVRGGQVYRRVGVQTPEQLVQLMKEELK